MSWWKHFACSIGKNTKQIPNRLFINYISKKVDTSCDTDLTIHWFLIVFINRRLRVSQLSLYSYMVMVDGWYSILTCIFSNLHPRWTWHNIMDVIFVCWTMGRKTIEMFRKFTLQMCDTRCIRYRSHFFFRHSNCHL